MSSEEYLGAVNEIPLEIVHYNEEIIKHICEQYGIPTDLRIHFGEDIMTEKEWLTSSDPRAMFSFIAPVHSLSRLCWIGDIVTDRKLRLFAVAHCRKFLCDYDNGEHARHLDITEHMAENNLPPDPSSPYWIDSNTPLEIAGHIASITYSKRIAAYNANLLREIFGNPWIELVRYSWQQGNVQQHSHRICFRHEWTKLNNGTVGKMALDIYKERDWKSLPILADALEDVDCNATAVMDHFRDNKTEHVRGCWALDLVLGKDKEYDRSKLLPI